MKIRKGGVLGVCLLTGAAALSPSLSAKQTCTSSPAAAVKCFVANAVSTNMTSPRYGMTLGEFEAYGVAVSTILQTHHDYLTLVALSSAVADAMPPTNADGSADQAAQDLAVEQLVAAAVQNQLLDEPAGVSLQDEQWFTLDVTGAMNDNNGYMSLMTPGVSLRIIDSYVVTATSNGTVNWTQADQNISNAVDSFISSGLIKIPTGVTTAQVKAFLESAAQTIYSYKVSTGRTSL